VVKKSPKNYPKELQNCSHCDVVMERDVNPGINIKNRALQH
jgi:transposase